MKKPILFLMILWISAALAATYHTLPFNGNNVFTTDEQFITSTDTISAYCTWDAAYLYLAYTSGFLGFENDTTRGHYTIFWYIDTDPHPDNPKSGAGHDTAATYWTQIMPQEPWWFDEQSWELPFNADYYIKSSYVNKDSVYMVYGPWQESKHTWGHIGMDTMYANLNLTQDYYEIRMPLDSLANPSDIFIVGYIASNEWKSDLYWNPDPQRDVGGTLGSWPWSSIRGGDGDKGPDGHLDHWFHFHLQNGISPDQENDPPVVSDIPGQAISKGDIFATIDLNAYVFDDLTPDTLLNWSVSGNTDLTVTIGDSNQADITVNNPNWTGSDTLTFTAADQGGKTDSDTAVFTVNGTSALHRQASGRPIHFSLKQNYPNPFNPATVISFGLPRASMVRLDVFNMLGQNVYSLRHKFAAGFQKITVNAERWPAGSYFYRIHAGTFKAAKKMILIK